MQLWTFHPPGFQVGDPHLVVEPRRGDYWNEQSGLIPCYQKALSALFDKLGTDQFIWCCSVPDAWILVESRPVVEWELNLPESHILAFVRESAWDALLKGQSEDWTNVIITEKLVQPSRDTSVLVRVPLLPEWVKCLGKLVRPEWRKEAEWLKRNDRATQLRFVNMYRECAADPNDHPVACKMYADRVDYLREFLGLEETETFLADSSDQKGELMAKPWRALEILAASIEQALSSRKPTVKTPDRIRDIYTNKLREVDVSIRFEEGSVPLLITMECRDRRRKEGIEWIEQLAKKKEALGANATIAVSTGGFTAEAIKKAPLYGIELRHVESIKDANVSDWFKALLVTVRYETYKPTGLVGIDWAKGDEIDESRILIPTWDSPVFVENPGRKPVSVDDLLAEWWVQHQPLPVGASKTQVMVFVPDPGTLYFPYKGKDHEIQTIRVGLEMGHFKESVTLENLSQYSSSLGLVAYAGHGRITTGLDKPLDFVVLKGPGSTGIKVMVRQSEEKK